MFCSKCGSQLNSGCLFCYICGGKVGDGVPSDEIVPAPVPVPASEPEPVPEEVINAIEALESALPPEQRSLPAKKEKTSFGVPALIFCLTVIGVLSVACGVLAMLYFGAIL
jgi:hypothetical protein